MTSQILVSPTRLLSRPQEMALTSVHRLQTWSVDLPRPSPLSAGNLTTQAITDSAPENRTLLDLSLEVVLREND